MSGNELAKNFAAMVYKVPPETVGDFIGLIDLFLERHRDELPLTVKIFFENVQQELENQD